MADITTQVTAVYQDGSCGHSALLAVKNATAGDTVDASSWFRVIKRAGMVSVTGTQIAAVTISGSTLTIPTGPNSDAVWLLAFGVAI
jgi:flavin-binding protein dodecin